MMVVMGEARFERLYEAHAADLYTFLSYRTGDRALAEDLTADTFERVLRARRRFDPRRASEKTWLYTIALNLLRDHQRRRGAEQRALSREAASASQTHEEPRMAAVEQRDSLAAALVRLAPEEQEALALRFGADLSVREIADVTRQSVTTAEGRIYRGLRKLRELLS